MIRFGTLRQYTQITDGIRYYPVDPKKPFAIVYFSENSTFLQDYPYLNLLKLDCRMVVLPITKVPRTLLTTELIKNYRSIGLFPFSDKMKIPDGRNIIVDLSTYLTSVDLRLQPENYRMRAGQWILGFINSVCARFSEDYNVILLYTIDTKKDFKPFIDRKIFALVRQLRENEQRGESTSFNNLVYGVLGEKGPRYRLLIKNQNYKAMMVMQFLRAVKKPVSGSEDEEVQQAAEKVINQTPEVSPESKEKVKSAIASYLYKNQEELDQISSEEEIHPNKAKEITTASILSKATGDSTRATSIAKTVSPKAKSKVLQNVDKKLSDEMLETQTAKSTSDNTAIQLSKPQERVDNKYPGHLFQKRQIDFDTNLKKDMTNSFKVLETKELPLKITDIKIISKPERGGEINKSDVSISTTTLTDEFKNTHKINIDIPNIDEHGTFRVNGKRKCLINQIVLCPISFPKAYDSKFESSYSIFHIRSKRTKKINYLEIYIGTYKIPLLLLLAFSFGFGETLKQYGIGYTLTNEKLKKGVLGCKINKDTSIVFSNVNTPLKEELVNSFIQANIEKYVISQPFGTRDYFNVLIISMTGRVNSTFLIKSNLENIVDPVAKQVLFTMGLPTSLDYIMMYMAGKTVEGFVQERNDLSNQRIRNSEVLVHLAQKQILAAYTVYKEQVLAGNKQAKFTIPQGKVLQDFILSEIVTNMEYANPVEEMATMTRISPVGKTIGGIPGKEAVQVAARNVHPTYFGNIDPLDTPEGDSIGISQQLAVGAMISSARGLFGVKEINDKEGAGMLSTSTSLIPFIENNDGARILMAANQARQMLPLKNPSAPAIQSGYETLLTNVLSTYFIKKSPCDGKVLNITGDYISVYCGKQNKTIKTDITPMHLKSGTGKDTLSVFNPVVSKGQVVKEGTIIAEGSCISGGAISLGRTLCVAMMPYKGYNFEDGIVINEKLATNDMLTSIHGIIEEVLVSEKDKIISIINIGEKTERGQPLIVKTVGEIEELIGQDETLEEEGIEISAGRQFIKKSPGGTVVDIEVYANVSSDKFPKLKDLILRTNAKFGKAGREKFTVSGTTFNGLLIKFKLEQELKIGLGDKLCNRYGNKGIISLVEKDELMPRTPWGDTIDIILNPLGMIGRMNVGQLYEMYCGLISKELARRIVDLRDKHKVMFLIRSVLSYLDQSPKKEYTFAFLQGLNKLDNAKFNRFVDQIQRFGFVPIIIPPFKAPKQENIKAALNVLGLKSGYQLLLPEFNTKTMNEVPVGYMYVSKLEHIGEMKIYGRSTGPVVGKTLQPTGGKRREGAQRVGEGDTYSLVTYNCTNLIAEFFGPLSDDHGTKNEIISEVIQNGSAKYKVPKVSPVRDLLNSYFISLMLTR